MVCETCLLQEIEYPFEHKHTLYYVYNNGQTIATIGSTGLPVVTNETFQKMMDEGYFVHCVNVPKQVYDENAH
jgi:hypothetical protein